jgi:hypothetical protein
MAANADTALLIDAAWNNVAGVHPGLAAVYSFPLSRTATETSGTSGRP